MSRFKTTMSEIVTNYLVSPTKEVEVKPQLESDFCHEPIWHTVTVDRGSSTIGSASGLEHAQTCDGCYTLQGMSIPFHSAHAGAQQHPESRPIKLIVLFIAGSNAHLFSSRQRAVECAYAARCALQSQDPHAGVLLSRFNPFGVVNAMQAPYHTMPYKPSPLTQDDLTNDYIHCAKSMLRRYPASDMIIVGHSLGGVFARKVFSALSVDAQFKKRVRFVYSAMSLPGIADAFMHYQPAVMLHNLIPQHYRSFLNWLINSANYVGFQFIQRFLKRAVEYSGWKTVADQINHQFIAQSNLVKRNLDRLIPDAVASVQSESAFNWLLSTEHSTNCHDLPPSQLYQPSASRLSSELEKLIVLFKRILTSDLCTQSNG